MASATIDTDATWLTNPVFTAPGAPLQQRLIIGGIYAVTSTVSLFIALSILYVFLTTTEYRKNPCYRIMTVMLVGDCIQLVVNVYGGVVILANNSFNPLMERVGIR